MQKPHTTMLRTDVAMHVTIPAALLDELLDYAKVGIVRECNTRLEYSINPRADEPQVLAQRDRWLQRLAEVRRAFDQATLAYDFPSTTDEA